MELDKCSLPNIREESGPKNYVFCKDGDVAFADASEDTNDVGKVVEFLNCKNRNIVCGLHTIHGRDKNNLTIKGFKGYAFSSKVFRHQIRRLSQGTKIYSISSKNFKDISIGIPSKEEQYKIATLLRLLDERTATQNKIIEDLRLLKSTISNLLLRNPNWKKYKIKDIGELGRGRVISTTEIKSQQTPKYPVYSSQTSNNGIMGYLDTYAFEGEYLTWTTDGANAGTVFYRKGKFNCTNVCGTIKVNDQHNPYFVSQCLQLVTRKYVSTDLANPKLMNNTMASIEITLPDKETQEFISDLLWCIDEKYSLENELVSRHMDVKKYLLSNLFA
ncbi:restriction endonuclease subunit S [Dysgonomonas sp. HDW5A]|nr:restriction endonuclease subunit S [Dysgonomonas sp. HDW5A]